MSADGRIDLDSIEMAAEQSVGVNAMLRTGERRTEDLVELERIQEFAEASDGPIRVISIDLPPQGASANNYQPLSAAELDVLDGKAAVEASAIVGLMPVGTPNDRRCFSLITFAE